MKKKRYYRGIYCARKAVVKMMVREDELTQGEMTCLLISTDMSGVVANLTDEKCDFYIVIQPGNGWDSNHWRKFNGLCPSIEDEARAAIRRIGKPYVEA